MITTDDEIETILGSVAGGVVMHWIAIHHLEAKR